MFVGYQLVEPMKTTNMYSCVCLLAPWVDVKNNETIFFMTPAWIGSNFIDHTWKHNIIVKMKLQLQHRAWQKWMLFLNNEMNCKTAVNKMVCMLNFGTMLPGYHDETMVIVTSQIWNVFPWCACWAHTKHVCTKLMHAGQHWLCRHAKSN